MSASFDDRNPQMKNTFELVHRIVVDLEVFTAPVQRSSIRQKVVHFVLGNLETLVPLAEQRDLGNE